MSTRGIHFFRLIIFPLLLTTLCLICATIPSRAQTPGFSASPTAAEILRAHVFEEPLVPSGKTTPEENAALASALIGYSRRNGPDDFSALTGFLAQHPNSPWRGALLTDLGIEYYNTANYSLAIEAWSGAWSDLKNSNQAKALADRAAGELAYMYARLGRMSQLEQLLTSVESRTFTGPATEKIAGAREGLWNMKNRSEVSFRCGPLALRRIKLSLGSSGPCDEIISKSASTTNGFSLSQVADLAKQVGLDYKMAFRRKGTAFVVPSVVHWKVGHYAAMLKREGDKYLLEDPTFGNTVWATTAALEEETSGYFLIPNDKLTASWREVSRDEGDRVFGKGQTGSNQAGHNTPRDANSGSPCKKNGMAVPSIHLMLVNLNLTDEPVGYTPPVGPPMGFVVRYNHREAFQPSTFTYANLGAKWTSDWISFITDNPQNPLADVTYFVSGGGGLAFTGFDTNSQTYAVQPYEQTVLHRTGVASYEMTYNNGTKFVFGQSDGSTGTSRRVFLTQMIDASGNAATLTYDGNLRITAITDAIGQVTTLSYSNGTDIYKITRVTDPFGRFASFSYSSNGLLTNITDVIGMNSQFTYQTNSDFITALTTPYGTTTFVPSDNGNTRVLEIVYPDSSRERVEYNQTTNLIAASDAPSSVPLGMATANVFLCFRNTYYWTRNACDTGYRDYSKARIFHWLHTADLVSTSGILESTKEPLEGRVWYDYAGQSSANVVGANNLPTHIGRVLDDGSTQLYTYGYDSVGNVTNAIDPVGRTFSYVYATNGIDLIEVRQTRAGKNELLVSATYNSQHLPLTTTDAAGQTTTFTYNASGQLLTETNPKHEVTTYNYDTNGYLLSVDGPLPGTNDVVSMTYDSFGRMKSKTDVSGYTVTFDYDALDRITRVTYPDSTFDHITYNRLDASVLQDRAGRQTFMEYDSVGQLVKRTDPLNRVSIFQWCSCGDLKSMIDPMGRITTWHRDVQERVTSKEYGDGSQQQYFYENTASRVRQFVDENGQITRFTFNRDNSMQAVNYANTTIATLNVSYTYDSDYNRLTSMTDGVGTTTIQYAPITSTPTLGAGLVATVNGPLPNNTMSYSYDELGRIIAASIDNVVSKVSYDAAARMVGRTNTLGSFAFTYDGASSRLLTATFPNGQTTTRQYADVTHDFLLNRMTYQFGANPISDFIYTYDNPRRRIATWSQQAGAQTPDVYTFGYDNVNQLVAASVTNGGALTHLFGYSYDADANRLVEQIDGSTITSSYNALNQINTSTSTGVSRTNEYDGQRRLVAVNSGGSRTEFAYDGLSRLASIRQLSNGTQVSLRRFVWVNRQLVEERDGSNNITKRFFEDGVQFLTGANAGNYFYTRDHLGSIRELTDNGGNVRARYAYDPFGRRTKVTGDLDADFGFAQMFFASEVGISTARFRAYDASLGRWLSRDPLRNAEREEGPNLYAYVRNNSINATDPLGLSGCCDDEKYALDRFRALCGRLGSDALERCSRAIDETPEYAISQCEKAASKALNKCVAVQSATEEVADEYLDCVMLNHCPRKPCGAPNGSTPPKQNANSCDPNNPYCQLSQQILLKTMILSYIRAGQPVPILYHIDANGAVQPGLGSSASGWHYP